MVLGAETRSPPLPSAYPSLMGSFTITSAKPAVCLQAHLRLTNYHLFAAWLDIRDDRVGEAVLKEGTDSTCEKSPLGGICTIFTRNTLL